MYLGLGSEMVDSIYCKFNFKICINIYTHYWDRLCDALRCTIESELKMKTIPTRNQ